MNNLVLSRKDRVHLVFSTYGFPTSSPPSLHGFGICVFVCLCICVFVFVYFDVRHLGTLFLRSSNNILFKNIAHDRSISKFYPNCICVFVYLCICICVFGYPRLLSDQLELFVTSPFSLTFSLGHSKWPKKC